MPFRLTAPGEIQRWHWLAFFATLLASMTLYFPFVGNELIFDDTAFFYGGGAQLSHYAVTPFDLAPRTFPYFTFAFIQTVTQSFEIQRLVNLGLHGINGYLLFLLCEMLQSVTVPKPQLNATKANNIVLIGGGIALAFVVHPVAVYGAGYLVQRTILFATLFSLLALLKLGKAFKTGTWQPLIWAAFFSILAMFAKEHAVTLPLAVVGLLWAIRPQPSADHYLKAAVYLLLCAPAAFWLVYRLRGVVASPYESSAPIYIQDTAGALWPRSALTECGLYFDYFRLWLLPNTALMSIDLRAPFPEAWSSPQALLGGAAFLSSFAAGSYLLLRSERYRLLGLGLIYTQVLFLVELSTVRVQEPFVLYRSYLWAPGFLLMAVSLLQQFPQRAVCLVFTIILPILAYQAVDRLNSISSGMNAWADARAKLTSNELPGAFRIYHNLGVHYLKAKQNDLALTDFVTCNRLNPSFAGCLAGIAVVLSRGKNYEPALMAINTALQIDPKNPSYWETKGNILKKQGQSEQANTAFAEAEALGGSIATILRRNRSNPLSTTNPGEDNLQK